MSASDSVRVKTDQLPVGSRLSHPINDAEDRLLLAAGVLLTKRLKDRLIERGIWEVMLHPDDAAAILGGSTSPAAPTPPSSTAAPPPPPATQRAKPAKPPPPPQEQAVLRETVAQIKAQAAALAATVSNEIRNQGPPLSESRTAHGTKPYNTQQRERLLQYFSATTEVVEEIISEVLEGRVHDERPLRDVAENFVAELCGDSDNVISSSTEAAPSPSITERAVRLSVLGMAMAFEMQWDEQHVRDVGLCGLVHDFGMYRLDEELRDTQAEATPSLRQQLSDHPLHTLDMLTTMKSISLPVRLAATQVHENPNGTGYPRGIKSDEIHPYAALLHVADSYITLTAVMHGRQAYLSYDVMVYLLNQVKVERMEEFAVRALLQAVSLFPIGSHVRLSDGSEAVVIRRNSSHYTQPIVQRVGADRQPRPDSPSAVILDLADSGLRVTAPLLPPGRQESRLDESLNGEEIW